MSRSLPLIVALGLLAAGCQLERFEGGIGDCWDQQEAEESRIEVVDNPNGSGEVLKVEVHAGDVAIRADAGTGKSRAELHMTAPCRDRYAGDSEWFYGWDVLVPADYPVDGTDSFQLIGQWKQEAPGSPQISVHLGRERGQPVFRVKHRPVLDAATTDIAVIGFEPGEWTHLAFRIAWSTDPDVGMVDVRVNGEPVLAETFRGATSYEGESKGLKIGLYRGVGYTTNNTLYFDDLTVGTSWALVGAG